MSSSKTYVVTGALALVRNEQGGVDYLYTGATLPKGTSGDECKRLVETGLVTEVTLAEVSPEATRMGTSAPPPEPVQTTAEPVKVARR